MDHQLEQVDLVRDRMQVGYQEAVEALDQSEGDVVRALAYLESTTAGGLHAFEEQVREGVKRGLSGEKLTRIRWKILGQSVAEAPLALVGAGAIALGLIALLITSSTVETEYAPAAEEADEG